MFINRFVVWLLTSPGHFLLSGNTAVLHIRGTRTGALYHVPVSYVKSGDTLTVVSSRDRTWWRNLRDGAPLSLQLRGANTAAHGIVLEDSAAVSDALRALVTANPRYARMLGMQLDENGDPLPTALARATADRVIVQLQLGTEAYQPPAVNLIL